MKKILFYIRMFLFDPIEIFKKLAMLPLFIINLITYNRKSKGNKFKITLNNIWYRSYDRYSSAGNIALHYFYQDLWAAKKIFELKVSEHYDIGSSIEGFIAHVLSFCSKVHYVDIRPLNKDIEGLEFHKGSILELPFKEGELPTLSCLHVIEHIGLGRYGDPIMPDGYIVAAKELSRVLKTGGILLISTPVGKERLCFDAHRVFDPKTIIEIFNELKFVEFSLIDDIGKTIERNSSLEKGARCNYGCGLFVFQKELGRK